MKTLGIVGGTGWIGSTFTQHILTQHLLAEQDLWIANRSGDFSTCATWPKLHCTTDVTQLLEYCDTILIAVLPQQFKTLSLAAPQTLFISIMAGVSIADLQAQTQSPYIVRSMPNAAAEIGLSYTPWYATEAVTTAQRETTQSLLSTIGTAEPVDTEDHINFFTGLTGSGHGLLAYMANSMVETAMTQGIDRDTANRSVRELFRGIGTLLAVDTPTPDEIVHIVTEYAGTTAAGVKAMQDHHVNQGIAAGIHAAYQKAKSDMTQ